MRTPISQFGPSYHRSGRVHVQRDGGGRSILGGVCSDTSLDDLEVPRLEVTLAPSSADALSEE